MKTNEHQIANQIFTLISAVNAKNEWTLEEISKMRAMKDAGISVRDIAVVLGRTYYSVSTALSVNNLTKANPRKSQTPKVEACPNCFLVHKYECEG